jgi:hypothetical protein
LSDSSARPPGPTSPGASVVPPFDLNAAFTAGAIDLSAETREHPADQAHRHRQEAADATLRRVKDGLRFGLSALFLSVATILALRFILDQSAAADEKAWARTFVSAIASAVAGYFIGKGHRD